NLATPEVVRSTSGRVRRLARDLPRFESVWIDALAQARLLTPYQASEITAGRGHQLLVGPYVIERAIDRLGYADAFIAVEKNSKDEPGVKKGNWSWLSAIAKSSPKRIVHLMVARGIDPVQAQASFADLQTFANTLT